MEGLDGDQHDHIPMPDVGGANGDVPGVVRPGQPRSAISHPDPLGALTLLGLGLLLEGTSLVMRQASPALPVGDAAHVDDPDTGEGAVMRRALIGLVVDTRARAQRRREAIRQTQRDVLRRLGRAAAPITHWLPVEVTLTATEILADYGQRAVEQTVSRLARQGQIEEEQARALAQRAILGWIDETLTYATRTPAVRELVTQQGEELAASALDDMRARTESVDTWLAQAARKVLKRPPEKRAPARAESTESVTSPRIAVSEGSA